MAKQQLWKRELAARELKRRAAIPAMRERLLASLFPAQRALAEDDAKVIAAHPGRRAGKTYGVCARLCVAALSNPDSTIPFIHRTLTAGSSLMGWRTLRQLNKTFSLGAEFRTNPLKMAIFPGGGKIWFVGADKEDQIEKLRGEAYPEAWVDEAGTYRRRILTTLIHDILEPALAEYDGVLGMAGTPGYVPKGPFWKECTQPSEGTVVHRWTMLDNPHVPNARTWLKKRKEKYGWSDENSTYRREYLGEWVSDKGGLVYRRFDPVHNIYEGGIEDAEEPGRWNYVLGIDYGFRAPSAFAVLAYDTQQPRVRIIQVTKKEQLLHTAVAVEVEKLNQVYGFSNVMVDAAHPELIEAIKQRGGVHCEGAKKQDKMAFIEIMNDEFATGIVKANATHCEELFEEYAMLPLTDSSDENKLVEDKNYANHAADAALYAWRGCHHYYSQLERLREPRDPREVLEEQLFAHAEHQAGAGADNAPWRIGGKSEEGPNEWLGEMGIRNGWEDIL